MGTGATPDKKTVIRELIEQGKAKGQLSTKEILDALGELDFEPEQIEKFYDTLEAQFPNFSKSLIRTSIRRSTMRIKRSCFFSFIIVSSVFFLLAIRLLSRRNYKTF